MADRRDRDWVEQVPDHYRNRGPYEDYGWESRQSVLPEFRDPSIRRMPYESRYEYEMDRGFSERRNRDWSREWPENQGGRWETPETRWNPSWWENRNRDYDRGNWENRGRSLGGDYGMMRNRGFDRDYDTMRTRDFDRDYGTMRNRDFDRDYGMTRGRGFDRDQGTMGNRDFDRDYWESRNRNFGRNYGTTRNRDYGWNYADFDDTEDWRYRDDDLDNRTWRRTQNRDWDQNEGWTGNRSRNFGTDWDRGWQEDTGWSTSRTRSGRSFDEGSMYTDEPSWSYTEVWLIPGPHTGMGPEGYQRPNESIHEEACERLTRHGQLDASNITINVEGDEITLEGTVDNRRAKRMAEDALEGISGVRDIHNHLRVQERETEGLFETDNM